MRLSITILTISCITFSIFGCKKAEEKKDTTIEITTLQGVEILSLQPIKPVILPGELLAWNKVNIYSKVKGFVKQVKVDRGSIVKKGQTLSVLDAPELISELDQAKGELFAAEASFHESKAKFSSSRITYQRLLKASKTLGAIALNELDQAQAKMLADSAMVSTAEGNLNAAKSHFQTKSELVNYLTILAPFDGIIIEKNISPGSLIGAGDPSTKPMFVLEDNSTLRLTVAIPENYSNSVRRKSSVTFKVNSSPDKEFKAILGRSSESVLEKNRVMMTEFDFDNSKGDLKAGMYAEVKLPIERSSPTLFVPTTAVVNSSEKTFIIRSNQNKVEWVNIKKGITLDTLTEVFGKIQAGELIVKEASEELREGQIINLKK